MDSKFLVMENQCWKRGDILHLVLQPSG